MKRLKGIDQVLESIQQADSPTITDHNPNLSPIPTHTKSWKFLSKPTDGEGYEEPVQLPKDAVVRPSEFDYDEHNGTFH
jgi:hypothetical protein